eukprot:SM000034S12795  [mRNA]  locus=s34:807597:812161:+ [translate_table: standard]
MERFYDSIGGILGYQLTSLELIRAASLERQGGLAALPAIEAQEARRFLVPAGPNLAKDRRFAAAAASWGLEGLPSMAEIYPLGGAGDRLGLVDERTGECLPVAMLPYCGRTLLEGLIRDLQAREYLHFRVFGGQHTTPVAIMTSAAKQNHARVQALCESRRWFGRGRKSFRLFEQPLVPTVAADSGKWLMSEPLTAVLKPGGHGVIWKLAADEGIFDWFRCLGRSSALVRQISNPLAATDVTLLALSGSGLHNQKKFGFASCDRNVGTAEGVNVLVETHKEDGTWEYGVTCIEYTEFDKLGIADVPVSSGSMQSQYPANTNVLYVDLEAVERVATSKGPAALPGLIMNLKKQIKFQDQFGRKHSVRAGRLECTMQNIADSLVQGRDSRLAPCDYDSLDTFLVYNERRKVTSSAKRRRNPDELSLHQTPDGSILDLYRNARELFSSCGVAMPLMESNQCYLDTSPPYMMTYHPALGPLWDVIRQKVHGGSIATGSEVVLEIAELYWRDVEVQGSLLVHADNIMGATVSDESGEHILDYGRQCGRCRLERVRITNRGVDWDNADNVYWQHRVSRHEAARIVLHGSAEFEACDVTIEGQQTFEVPTGHRMRVSSSASGGALSLCSLRLLIIRMQCHLEPLSSVHSSWEWKYELHAEDMKVEPTQTFSS